MANSYDFYPFAGGVSIKINGDDGNDVPSGIWKIETRGNTLEIKHVQTDRVLHTIIVGTDIAKISGGVNVTDPTVLKTALQAVFFKAGAAASTTAADLSSVYVAQTVATYSAAQAAATGTQRKEIRVTADETNGEATVYYRYEGIEGVLIPDFTKMSASDFDIVNGQIVYRVTRLNTLFGLYLNANGYTANIKPPAPTGGTVNDGTNIFSFVNVPGYITSDHHYSINGGAYVTCTSNDIIVGNIDIPIGGIIVRVMAAAGRSEGDILSNATAFTAVALSAKYIDAGLASGATSTYNGQTFEADTAYVTAPGTAGLYTDPGAVTNTSAPGFYQSVRYQTNTTSWTYTFPSIVNGDYTVIIHTRTFGTAAASVGFIINGTTVETGLDPYVASGSVVSKALRKSYNVTVTNGQIVLGIVIASGQFNLAGIEIVSQGTASKLI